MSAQAFSYVIQHSKHKGSELLCLLMIANHAHADGTNSFPGIETLAAECRMSTRQIRRIIDDLEASGELLVVRGRGRGVVHTFTVVMQPTQENRTSCHKTGQVVHNTPVEKQDKLSQKTGQIDTEKQDISDIKQDISATHINRFAPVNQRTKYITVIEGESNTREDAPPPKAVKTVKPKSTPTTDDQWLLELRDVPAYAGIDIDREYSKCQVWCDTNNATFSRRRFVNWLNKADRPLSRASPSPLPGNLPPGRTRLTPNEERIAAENARIDATTNALLAQLESQ